jgi:hypothetical protein
VKRFDISIAGLRGDIVAEMAMGELGCAQESKRFD